MIDDRKDYDIEAVFHVKAQSPEQAEAMVEYLIDEGCRSIHIEAELRSTSEVFL